MKVETIKTEFETIHLKDVHATFYMRDVKKGAGEVILRQDGYYFGYYWSSIAQDNIKAFIAQTDKWYFTKKITFGQNLKDEFSEEETKQKIIEEIEDFYKNSPANDGNHKAVKDSLISYFKGISISQSFEVEREINDAENVASYDNDETKRVASYCINQLIQRLYEGDIVQMKACNTYCYIRDKIHPALIKYLKNERKKNV